jgi:hypothetical protein
VDVNQLGQGSPVIDVHRPHGKGPEALFEKILRLTLTDAQELATALRFIVETADQG